MHELLDETHHKKIEQTIAFLTLTRQESIEQLEKFLILFFKLHYQVLYNYLYNHHEYYTYTSLSNHQLLNPDQIFIIA